jgi:flavin reductase (DIM6/NTAB) family NADH-FMN oxidoreductase RutF
MTTTFTPRELRDAFGTFATGVTVVTAVRADGQPVGTTANSFTSVSLDPPLLLWCIGNASASLPAFVVGAPFAVHVLAQHQRDVAMRFAQKGGIKFDGDVPPGSRPVPPRIPDALCRFDCQVQALHPAGDHHIVVGDITGLELRPGPPLTFHAGRFGTISTEPVPAGVGSWGDHGTGDRGAGTR